jgi:glycosyltransferase involved in cell wall biosynthesis
MKVAIVYDRVNKWGGAERVLLTLHELFPEAPLYTAVYDAKKAPWARVFPKVVPSFLQKIPFLNKKHEFISYLTPLAFESFNFSEYDLVISVTSESAKGIVVRGRHICYCLTPTRYLWSSYDFYFRNPFLKIISKPVVNYQRNWDFLAAQRPNELIAISTAVQKRIKKYYQRKSQIVFPPVDLSKFDSQKTYSKKDYYLLVSRLVPYKKVNLAIEAFNRLGKKLIVVGTGSQSLRLKYLAKRNISFIKNPSDSELAKLYGEAKALIFPQEEDFGIVALEAQAMGTPVIAFEKGGATDTVISGKTGIFFEKQTVGSLIKAVADFEKMKFEQKEVKANAQRFSKEFFKQSLLRIIENTLH